jgi:hypothetical protein
MTSLRLSISEYNLNSDYSLTLSNTSSNDQAVKNGVSNGGSVQCNERQTAGENSRVFNAAGSTRSISDDLRARDTNTGAQVNINNPMVKSFLDKVRIFW